MTTKAQVKLDSYRKKPRDLSDELMTALEAGGDLAPVLAAVKRSSELRLDIRDRRFNVYYSGGSLLLVDGRKSPPTMMFDKKYFKGRTAPDLPDQLRTVTDSLSWVAAFPELMEGMREWWGIHPNVERAHCQAIANANSASDGLPSADYLVLDLEYQWAQRRFDMVAARRRPTEADKLGWAEPQLALVEVKSKPEACFGKSGIASHVRDYQDIVAARGRSAVQEIKCEYQTVIRQKRRLGLLHESLPFDHFSADVPELLIVLDDLDPLAPPRARLADELTDVSKGFTGAGALSIIRLSAGTSPPPRDWQLKEAEKVPLGEFLRPR